MYYTPRTCTVNNQKSRSRGQDIKCPATDVFLFARWRHVCKKSRFSLILIKWVATGGPGDVIGVTPTGPVEANSLGQGPRPCSREGAEGAISSKIKHAVKLKTSPVGLAQLLQPTAAALFSILF